MRAFQLAFLSLRRRRFSTSVCIFCVATAVFACGLLLTLVAGHLDSYEEVRSDHVLLMGPKSGGLDLLLGGLGLAEPSKDIVPFSLVPAIERRTGPLPHWIPLLALGQTGDCYVYGTNANYYSRPEGFHSPQLVAGEPMPVTAARRLTTPSPAVPAMVGQKAAHRLGLKPGERFTITGQWQTETAENDWTCEGEVRGILDMGSDPMADAVLVDLHVAWEHYRWALDRGVVRGAQNRQALSYALFATAPDQEEPVHRLIHNNSVAQIVDIREEIETLNWILERARIITWALCTMLLLLVFALMGVLANTRYETLRPELGLLRSLGYSRSRVGACLVLEILSLAIAGVLVSIALEALLLGVWDLPYHLGFRDTPTAWPLNWNIILWAAATAAALCAVCLPLARLYRTAIGHTMTGL